jgi:hypothetical protein
MTQPCQCITTQLRTSFWAAAGLVTGSPGSQSRVPVSAAAQGDQSPDGGWRHRQPPEVDLWQKAKQRTRQQSCHTQGEKHMMTRKEFQVKAGAPVSRLRWTCGRKQAESEQATVMHTQSENHVLERKGVQVKAFTPISRLRWTCSTTQGEQTGNCGCHTQEMIIDEMRRSISKAGTTISRLERTCSTTYTTDTQAINMIILLHPVIGTRDDIALIDRTESSLLCDTRSRPGCRNADEACSRATHNTDFR